MKIVQVIDTKKGCKRFYSNKNTYKNLEEIPGTGPIITWNHSHLMQEDCVYLSLYYNKINLHEYCEQHNVEKFIQIEQKIKNIIKSYMIAKVNLKNECYEDYIPEKILSEYLSLKEESMSNFYAYNKKPPEYDTLSMLHKLCQEISDYQNPSMSPGIRYNIFGTKTGRLTTKPGSFPILTLAKEKRESIKAVNGGFVEFDYNAAEIRTMLALAGAHQPEQDIHIWNSEMLPNLSLTRDQIKKRFFAWLYNPKSEDSSFSDFYDKDSLLGDHWDGKAVKTFFGRVIPCDRDHALNYVLQSTTSDLVLRSAYRIMQILKTMKSKIAFVLHDSVVIDCDPRDSSKIESLAKTFANTELGKYRTNIKIGKDFFNMKEVGYV
jgi:hypothetical protein